VPAESDRLGVWSEGWPTATIIDFTRDGFCMSKEFCGRFWPGCPEGYRTFGHLVRLSKRNFVCKYGRTGWGVLSHMDTILYLHLQSGGAHN
jgi:hypothetical protein